LSSYSWLGNVRELQNVIERAVITSRDGRLNLDRALPEVAKAPLPEPVSEAREGGSAVITIQEMERLERNNLMRALETTKWRVAGADGAARLLGMNPSTLSSRLKALGIERPRR
jgi:transcriptional regulator with GAF, ATPase, and Fis domain